MQWDLDLKGSNWHSFKLSRQWIEFVGIALLSEGTIEPFEMNDDLLLKVTENDFWRSSSFEGLILCQFLWELNFDSDSVVGRKNNRG